MKQYLDWTQVQTVQEICMLAPTRLLADKARHIIAEQHAPADVFVAVTDPSEIIACATALSQKGAKIIISRKGTQQIVEGNVNIKVVGLNNTLTDYLQMLTDRGLHMPGLIAFFTYDPMSEEVMRMCKMVDVQVKNYLFKDPGDCEDCVLDALRDGAVYSIGGAWTAPVAARLGLPHVILENSEDSIINALTVARQIRTIQVEEAARQQVLKTRMETYQAVLNFTHDAILSIDEQGLVQVLNPVAERIVGCKSEDAVGQPVKQILPGSKLSEVLRSGDKQMNQMMQINQTLTNTNRIPIVVDGQIRGVVATFQDVKQLQSSEQKIRIKLHEKGLVAKYSFADILGESAAIRSAIAIARSYATSQAAVLIHGETGTGKELFAQSIHRHSGRGNGPFVALNCAAVSTNLLESELFGYEGGSFTGAAKDGRIGLFELAHGGTLFLDEIGEIPKETQVELLRVLQEKEIRRVGGNRVIPVDVRIVTATNKDLSQEVAEQRFREDLYYRLNVLDLEVPPLRQRGQDVELLGLHYFNSLFGTFSPTGQEKYLDLLAQMQDYPWHGNIRELQSFTERIHILLQNSADLSGTLTEMMRRHTLPHGVAAGPTPGEDSQERSVILAAVQRHPGSLEAAARSLGCSRQTLWRKMKKYHIPKGKMLQLM